MSKIYKSAIRRASHHMCRRHGPSALVSPIMEQDPLFKFHGLWIRYSSSSSRPVQVAIVGSGPSGCYTAKYLRSAFRKHDMVGKIDVLERLPTPFGLVRSGVAPDHPEVKNVQNDFSALFQEESISFLGNVTVGKDVSLQELRELYDVVVLAYGCESDRKLGVPGEDTLRGVLSAREFVAWYNGHPDYVHIGETVAEALGGKPENAQVVVIGQGNVALDCARILAKGYDGLKDTDISSRALSVLKGGVQLTTVLGRRGHTQGAFTIKELRELTKLDEEGYNTSFLVDAAELNKAATPSSLEELNGPGSRPRVRIDKLLRDAAAASINHENPKQVSLRFLLNPIRFQPSSDNPSVLGSLVCERTRLEGQPGIQKAVGTGEEVCIPAQMALVSIGYKGIALPELKASSHFDEWKGVCTSSHGRVDAATGKLGGLYVSGWLKRGPSGIIGTNIADAKDTVASIIKDLQERPALGIMKTTNIQEILDARNVQVVDWSAYERIDATESSSKGRRSDVQTREKIADVDELLRAASANEVQS